MHPQNIFSIKPPVFYELALKYEKFRKKCYIGPRGKVCVDFKNSDAVKCLSEVLLLEYFSLNVSFSNINLVPRIPQRLNYILLIKDIIILNNYEKNVYGIDIGTGASCIYAFLGVKQCNWTFHCTEIDILSIEIAKKNIKQNHLAEFIIIHQTQENSIFNELFKETNLDFTFSMCNPPFFDYEETDQRFLKTQTGIENYVSSSKNAPKSFTVANLNEVCVTGGEIEFVSQMFKESLLHKNRVKIFSTMVGKKSSINKLKKIFQSMFNNVEIFVSTIEQGKTHRWVIFWSFQSKILFPTQ